MVSYYQLRLSSDPAVIGVRNGVQQVEIQDGTASNVPPLKEVIDFFCRDAMASAEFLEPPFELEFPYVKPLEKAILTDFLSFGPFFPSCPFMASESVMNVFSSFNIQKHRFYNARVVKNGAAINYKMLYCPALGYDVLDFQSSLFYSGSAVAGKRYLNFDSVDAYKDFLAANSSLLVRAERLALSPAFDDSLDLMALRFGGFYISSRLRDEILRLGLSGANPVSCFDENGEGRSIHLHS